MKRKHGSGTIYKRGSTWWIAYRVGSDRVHESAGTGDRRQAAALLAQRLHEIAEGTWSPPSGHGTRKRRTFAEDWAAWLETRDDVKTHKDDVAVGTRHILPFFGALATAEVTTAHVLDWHAEMRRKLTPRGTPLAKNSLRNIDARLVTFFADMEQRQKIARSPYAGLRRSQHLKRATRHEVADAKRSFTRAEVEALLYSEAVPEDRRVLYALQLFTGTRFGEAAGLRWSDYVEAHPLAMLRIERQYAGQPLKGRRGEPGAPRRAPVHPELAAILTDWRRGFEKMACRLPRASDFIVPSRTGRCRSLRHMGRKLSEDLERLGLEPTEQTHAFRRAMKTLAVASGAHEPWIERVIHNAGGGVAAGYLADDWPAMCAAIACIPVARPSGGEVIELRGYSVGYSGTIAGESAEKESGVGGTRTSRSAADRRRSRRSGALASMPEGPADQAGSAVPVPSVTLVTNLAAMNLVWDAMEMTLEREASA